LVNNVATISYNIDAGKLDIEELNDATKTAEKLLTEEKKDDEDKKNNEDKKDELCDDAEEEEEER